MSVIVVSTGPRTAANPVPQPPSAIGEQAPGLRPERAGRSLSLVETVRVDSPSGGRRGRAEVGQAASLPAAPAGAKSAAKAIPTGGRLAACPTLACARRLFHSWGARLLGLVAGAGLAWAQGTAFSYQGQLTDGAAAANGTYDLRFTLWNAATAGDPQGAILTQAGVGVTNGLFTATLDFGAQFNGQNRWLEIAVRTNGAATFTTLAERQPVLPTPYAIHATTATTATTVTGSVPVSQLTGTLASAQIPNLDANKITGGTFTGNGSGLVSLNAAALSSGTVPTARIPDLDAGKITTGTLAAARIPSLDASKIASGVLSPDRIPTLNASKISGGTFTGNGAGLLGIPLSALVQTNYSVTAWGSNAFGQTNMPGSLSGVVAFAAGQFHSLALLTDGSVAAWGSNGEGESTVPSELGEVVAVAAGAGYSLALKADGTVVGWGVNYAGQTTVPVGLSGVVAIAAGGSHGLALKADGTVTAWGDNLDGQANVPAGLSGVVAIAAGDFHSLALKPDGTVTAWGDNLYGQANVPAGLSGVVAISAGGSHNLALRSDGTVVAWGNSANGRTTVPGGLSGVVAISAGSSHSLALQATVDSATLARLDQGNVFRGAVSALGFSGDGSGLTSLNASALGSGTVPAARIPDLDAGKITTGTLAMARIPNLDASKITTGTLADARLSGNVALENGSPAFTAVAGARVASFTGARTGDFNAAVVHVENTQTGSTAAPALRVIGRGGDTEGALSVTANAGTIARFGNFTTWVAKLDNAGNFSATSFLSTSDRNRKAGFEPVDVEGVLAKVAGLPLTTWHYTNDAAATPHLGPMAQDFHAAFGLGGDDKTIATVDADGVALAAIQGLNHRTEALAAENAAIREELARQQTANADLRDELGDLRALVRQLQQQLNANRP
jgi:hypothetical protein